MKTKKFDNLDDIAEFIQRLTTSVEWRNLQGKSQVFDEAKEGVKTRGAHSTDVGLVAARLISLMPGLKDKELKTERALLIGMLHDLGHIAYGHPGESAADSIVSSGLANMDPETKRQWQEFREEFFGKEYADANPDPCFEHNENSAILYIELCRRYGFEVDMSIVKGILAHSTSRVKELPQEPEQQAVRLADKIAYINYDTADLLRTYDKDPERSALMGDKGIYQDPPILTSQDEKEMGMDNFPGIKIEHNGKVVYCKTVRDFIQSFTEEERISIFTSAAVEDSKRTNGNITGATDLLKTYAEAKKAYEKNKDNPELKARYYQLKKDFMEKSPVMYLAYEMKDRSDNFIRVGKGLPHEAQVERTKNGLSFVGNKEFQNKFTYKFLALFLKDNVLGLEKKENKSFKEIDPKVVKAGLEKKLKQYLGDDVDVSQYVDQMYDFCLNYSKYRENKNKVAVTSKGSTLPDIYTISTFIGLHSNDQLTDIAENLGVTEIFENIVLPKISQLMSSPKYYDAKNASLTKEGRALMDVLIDKYGAHVNCNFSLEEEGISPLADEETIRMYREAGFLVDGKGEDHDQVQTMSNSNDQDALTKYREALKAEQDLIIRLIREHVAKRNKNNPKKASVGKGV